MVGRLRNFQRLMININRRTRGLLCLSSYYYCIISTLYNQLGQFIVLSHDSNLNLAGLCVASTSAIASLSVDYLLILLQSFIYDTKVFTIAYVYSVVIGKKSAGKHHHLNNAYIKRQSENVKSLLPVPQEHLSFSVVSSPFTNIITGQIYSEKITEDDFAYFRSLWH